MTSAGRNPGLVLSNRHPPRWLSFRITLAQTLNASDSIRPSFIDVMSFELIQREAVTSRPDNISPVASPCGRRPKDQFANHYKFGTRYGLFAVFPATFLVFDVRD